MHRATYCAHTSPLPLLPSGPGGVGGITSRRARHSSKSTIRSPSLTRQGAPLRPPPRAIIRPARTVPAANAYAVSSTGMDTAPHASQSPHERSPEQVRAAVDTRTAALHARHRKLEQRRRALGYAVTGTAALLAVLAGMVLVQGSPGWPVALTAAVLLTLVSLWQRLRRPLTRVERLQALYREVLGRIDGTAPSIARGAQFSREKHPYERDLSILGEHSLFAHLPPARTDAGAAALAALLLDPTGAPSVLERQGSVQELAPDLNLRERIELLGPSALHGISADRVLAWARTPVIALPRSASVALLLVSSGFALLAPRRLHAPGRLAARPPKYRSPGRDRGRHHPASATPCRRSLSRPPTVSPPRSPCSAKPSHCLLQPRPPPRNSPASVPPSSRPPAASRLLAQLESRLSIVYERHQQWFLLVSVLFAAGTQAAIALERWRARHGRALEQWIAAWAEFDALNALAAYAFEHPHHTFPTIDPTGPAHFEATGLRHPLLPPAHAIGNTIALNQSTRFLLISGSNMSGKSTLLRAIGSAVVLAYAGAPIPCTAARLSMLRLCASITPQDSLAEARSRFLAELEQLHAMLRPDPATPPTLFLIDEILGGTNSADRLAAARSILRRLVAEDAIGALSTHDLALTPIADDPALHGRNCHMSSPDPADPLRFDFALRPGINTVSSAPALLRLLGL